MDKLAQLWRRLRFLFGRDRFDRELDEEMRFHLEMTVEENLEAGMSPERARDAARRQFGNLARLKERSREAWSFGPADSVAQDLRYAARALGRSPGFAAVAIVALALGVGANTAIFSVVNAVLLEPLPYPQHDRLVEVWLRGVKEAGGDRVPLSVADLLDWRAQNQTFEAVGAFGNSLYNYTGGATPEQVAGARVTADFFDTLGVRAALGRTFLAEEERPGAPPVAVVSHGFWQRRMGADPLALGRTISLNGTAFAVVGVMPAQFDFPGRDVEVWTALSLEPPSRRGPYFLTGLARMSPGTTLEQARAEMQVIARRISGNEPKPDEGFNVVPLDEALVGDVRPALLVLFGAVGLVLLIASANVANLMLARATAREREMSIRAALGASRGRIVRQLLTESVVLAALGGAAGLLVAVLGVELLMALGPDNIPRLESVAIDGRVLGWTLAVSLVSGILFGLLPAMQASRPSLNDVLKDSGRGSTGGPGNARLRGALVVAEVALALMLLTGAGLLMNSFLRLQQVAPGFNPDRMLTMRVSLPRARYAEGEKRVAFYSQVLERVGRVPGVESVALASGLPPDRLSLADNFTVEGWLPSADESAPVGDYVCVSPGYFGALGVPLLGGRDFSHADGPDAPPVVIINETMARKFFPGQDPVGKRLKQGPPDRPGSPYMEIIGVVGDVKYRGLASEVAPACYTSYHQEPFSAMYIAVRAAADPTSLVPAVRSQVWSLDGELPVAEISTMDELLFESVAQPRFRTLLLAIFSAVALVLAAVGVYGVMAYSVTQRTHEIGIRMALGARPGDVLRLVIGQGLGLVLTGVAIGLAGALLGTRVLSGLLFGVSATDPATFASVALLLGAVALLACYVPARRAVRVDPMLALRHD